MAKELAKITAMPVIIVILQVTAKVITATIEATGNVTAMTTV